MPDGVVRRASEAERERVMAAVAEMADGGLAERMRLDAAARVLVVASRILTVAPREAATGASAALVLRAARGWDPSATTAAEHAETMGPDELDAFLAAAPRWASSVRDLTQETRRAA